MDCASSAQSIFAIFFSAHTKKAEGRLLLSVDFNVD